MVQAWREMHGNVCPGWEREAHEVVPPNVLTAAHLDAVAAGGDESGPLGVLCRVCNSRQGINPGGRGSDGRTAPGPAPRAT